MIGLIAVCSLPFAAGLFVCLTGRLITLVLGIEIVRVTVFVAGLAIFFTNATTT